MNASKSGVLEQRNLGTVRDSSHQGPGLDTSELDGGNFNTGGCSASTMILNMTELVPNRKKQLMLSF